MWAVLVLCQGMGLGWMGWVGRFLGLHGSSGFAGFCWIVEYLTSVGARCLVGFCCKRFFGAYAARVWLGFVKGFGFRGFRALRGLVGFEGRVLDTSLCCALGSGFWGFLALRGLVGFVEIRLGLSCLVRLVCCGWAFAAKDNGDNLLCACVFTLLILC